MATITYSYAPADGSPLSISGINGNIWSATSGRSIYGELNGYLNLANFDSGVTLEPGIVRRFDFCVSAQSGARTDQVFTDRLFSDNGYNSIEDDWISVASAGTRIYLDRDHDQVLYNVSAFVSALRQRKSSNGNPDEAIFSGPELYYQLFVDGVAIGHTRRPLPISWWPGTNPGPAVAMVAREQVLCRHIDLVHLDTGAITAGWHSVDLRFFMPRNTGQELLTPIGEEAKVSPANEPIFSNCHRVNVGIHSARIVAIG